MHAGGIILKVIVIAGVIILAVWGLGQREKSALTKAAFLLLAASGLVSGVLGIYIEYRHVKYGGPLLSGLGFIKSMFGGVTTGTAAALLLTGQLSRRKSASPD